VDVQIQRGAETLGNRQAAAPSITNPEAARAAPLEAEQRTSEDREDGATQAVVPGEHEAEPVGQAEHPLADGHPWQDGVDSEGGALSHAAAPTARAEPPPLAREGQEAIEPAALAAQAGEAVGQDPAREELAELVLDNPRQAGAVCPLGHVAKERVQMGAHDGVQCAALGRAGAVARGRAPQVGRSQRRCHGAAVPRRRRGDNARREIRHRWAAPGRRATG